MHQENSYQGEWSDTDYPQLPERHMRNVSGKSDMYVDP